jgi:hypothetical protein
MTKREGKTEGSVHFSSVQVDSDTKRKQLKEEWNNKKGQDRKEANSMKKNREKVERIGNVSRNNSKAMDTLKSVFLFCVRCHFR